MPPCPPTAARLRLVPVLVAALAGCAALPEAPPRLPPFVPVSGTFAGRLSVTSVGVYLIPCDPRRGAVPIANPEALSPVVGATVDDRFVRITGRIDLARSDFERASVPTLEVASLVALASAPCRIEPNPTGAAGTASRS